MHAALHQPLVPGAVSIPLGLSFELIQPIWVGFPIPILSLRASVLVRFEYRDVRRINCFDMTETLS